MLTGGNKVFNAKKKSLYTSGKFASRLQVKSTTNYPSTSFGREPTPSEALATLYYISVKNHRIPLDTLVCYRSLARTSYRLWHATRGQLLTAQ